MFEFSAANEIEVEVRYTGADVEQFRAEFGLEPRYVPQSVGPLGDRIRSAMAAAFEEGATRVVVIGTDCLRLDPSHLTRAFEQLAHKDVAIGPATDGGYYLLGTRRHVPQLFDGINWGTEHVLRQTLLRVAEAGVSLSQLDPLSDVDVAADLVQCRGQELPFDAVLPKVVPGRISIIIPTLNEASMIGTTLARLPSTSDVEVIVADGGSEDETVALARSAGALVVNCNQGRGQQMNAGAALSSGEFLLFLHADTQLPQHFTEQIRQTLSNGNAGGAFRLSIGAKGWLLRLVEYGANIRSRWLRMPYGDQAIFLPATVFFQLNGFRHIPLMEDYDFCRRLRRLGRISLADSSVVTSARRWQRLGVLRTTLTNLACVVAYGFGVSPKTLAGWYRRG